MSSSNQHGMTALANPFANDRAGCELDTPYENPR